ncbi:MAG: hypothetical protein AVDCRST_MAG30-39, partial [uncultured Solirubrobacteraceae bacterium]
DDRPDRARRAGDRARDGRLCRLVRRARRRLGADRRADLRDVAARLHGRVAVRGGRRPGRGRRHGRGARTRAAARRA